MGQRDDQIIYLDAGALIPALWDKDPGRASISEALIKHLRGKVESYDHVRVKIPTLQLGEIVKVFFEDLTSREEVDYMGAKCKSFMTNLKETLITIQAEFEYIPDDCGDVVRQLVSEDRDLKGNDLYLAAMAICDPLSTRLIAIDSDLVETQALQRVCRGRPEKRMHSLKAVPIDKVLD